jgi:CHASE2 domain-containing sensor protein
LAKTVEAAYKGKAKIIALDILLEERDCCHPEHDRRLRGVFQEMIDKKSPTKVIFPVRIGSGGEIKKSLYEDFIAKHPNFYTAIPYISATVSDRIVRYWVPYETVKGDSRYPFLWNVSFLTAMLAHGKESELKMIGQEIKGQKNSKTHFIKLNNMKEIEISSDRDDIYRNRIRFFLIPASILYKYPVGNLFEMVCDVNEVEYVTFKDKIVVIGNSNPDAGDLHLTPIGNMPGMYIIGNALNTILLGLQPSRPSMVLNMLIEFFVIIIAAYFLSRFPPLIIKIFKSIVLISILSAISYYYFLRTGVLLNITFAVLGMGFHDTALSIEKSLIRKKKTVNLAPPC